MSLQKKKRIVDRALLALYKFKSCEVCGKGPCDPAHFKTRGAGGNDVASNLIALCRVHHSIQHQQGIRSFWKEHGARIQAYRAFKGLTLIDDSWL